MAAAVRVVLAKQIGLVRTGILGLPRLKLVHTNNSYTEEKGKDKNKGTVGEDDIILDSVNGSEKQNGNSSQDYRTDYSDSEDPLHDQETDTKREILRKALEFVPEYGWSAEAISVGAESLGMSTMAEGMFPRGGGDLALHFIEDCNLRLAEHLVTESRAAVESPDKNKPNNAFQTDSKDEERRSSSVIIRDAVEVRLRMVTPHIDNWPQAMGLMLLPQNAPDAIRNVAYMVDEIWYHAGDTSTDINWYTKRGILAGLYASTELYFVQDRSPDFERTWSFLDRRIADIETLVKTRRSLEKASSDATKLFSAAITTARNMSGFNNRQRR